MDKPGPGWTVVDLGVGMTAALAAQMFAELGATVRRLEPPGGDPFRDLYPAYDFWRRDEKALAADALETALATADLCILGGEDFPGLDWHHDAAALAARHPRLVVLAIESYATPADRDRPAVDLLVQARMGIVNEQYSDRPNLFSVPLPSYGAALMGVLGAQAALFARHATGKGQVVRTSLQEGAAMWIQGAWSSAEKPDRGFSAGEAPRDVHPSVYLCGDDKWVVSVFGAHGSLHGTYQALNIDKPVDPADRCLPDIRRGPRNYFGDRDILEPEFLKFDRADVLPRLWENKVAADAAMEPGEPWDTEQVRLQEIVDTAPDGTRGIAHPIEVRAAPGPVAPPPARWRTPGRRRPLEGVKVVDLGAWIAGPFTSKLLAELGAEVIKVEPIEGDPVRPMYRIIASVSRGKRGLAVDLKSKEGQALVHRLVAGADIALHNMRVGVADRLGLDRASLRKANPDLVILESTAYGREGPRAKQPGFDPVFQGSCGHSIRSGGRGNAPTIHNLPVVDYGNGALGAVALLHGLLVRAAGGPPLDLDISLLGSSLYMLSELVQRPDGAFAGAPPVNPAQTGFHPAEQMYRASDGWIALSARSQGAADGLGRALGLDLGDFGAWGDAEADRIADAIAGRTLGELRKALEVVGVFTEACEGDGRVLLANPEARTLGLVVAGPHELYGEVAAIGPLIRFEQPLGATFQNFPSIGQDTRAILAELGLGDDEIDRLHADRVVA